MSDMNCKPGDLAVVVRTAPDERNRHLGRIVPVLRLSKQPTKYGPAWEYEGDVLTTWGRVPVIEDCALRPIRDPGDDAVDETLEWLDVPHKQGQPA